MAGELIALSVDTDPFSRNGVRVTVDHTDPNTWSGGVGSLQVEYSVNGGAFITPANVQQINNNCIDQPNPVTPGGPAQTEFIVWDPTIPHNANVEVRVSVNLFGPGVGDTLTDGPAVTTDYPTLVCDPAGPITQTEATVRYGANPPGRFNTGSCDRDQVVWELATVSGGPYTADPSEPISGLSPENTWTGLTPNTQYYYRARFTEVVDTNGEFLVGQECTFTTLAAVIPPVGPEIAPNAYAPRSLVEPPVCIAPRFGLASVVTLLDQSDGHELNGVTYQPRACVAPVASIEHGCELLATPNTKTPTDEVPDDVNGDPFTLYSTRTCRRSNLEAMKGEVAEDFEAGEWRGIEREIWNRILAQPTTTILNTVPGEAGALSVTAAIAALESYTSENYSCRALFHSDRGVTPYAVTDHQLVVVGGALNTFLGSAWAAYTASPNVGPDGTPAPDGHAWLYASSGLVLRRFPLMVLPETPEQMLTRDPATGQLTNEPFVLAERSYVPTVECGVAAVLVCLGACE